MGKQLIILLNEFTDGSFKLFYRFKTASAKQLSIDDSKEHFDLVHPRAMSGGETETNLV